MRQVLLIFAIFLIISNSLAKRERKFPENFRFGVATASYQIEGAWNTSDKGESVWDHFTHFSSHKVKDRSNGDVACNSYDLYKRDVEMLAELGVKFYRFSISWTRLLPKGFGHVISEDGLKYYNNLIDELIKYNIEPVITLLHWDTPQVLQDMGGWTNELIVDYFEDYARIVFEKFGDRVKEWVTFNEPYNMCLYGYGTGTGFLVFAPGVVVPGVAEYQCSHNVLKAHARAYHLYDEKFRSIQKGKVGMATVILWAEPETNSTEDIMIADKGVQFNTGWFGHPVFTKEGDYPLIMREEVDKQSKLQGFSRSRLPKFTQQEIDYIKGTFDFIGVNYYTAVVYRNSDKRPTKEVPSHENDVGYVFYQRDEWPSGASAWLKLRPEGLRDSLNWIVKEYGDHEIYILENGFSSKGGLIDVDRISYFNTHLSAVLDAMDDGCNVTTFTAWSLMDNFEWFNGYTERFGLYEVDFDSPSKTRTPRLSAKAYREIIESRKLNMNYKPPPIKTIVVNNTIDWYLIAIGVIVMLIVLLIIVTTIWSKRRQNRLEKEKIKMAIDNNDI